MNGRPASQSNQQNSASLLGTLLNLPNVELSMESSPQSAMGSSSANTIVVDGPEIDQGQSNHHGQQMDIGTPNSGQSTQARSNISTHLTTSTQTRSTVRPHVLHPHTHPLNVGMGMDIPATPSSTSTSKSNQANQSTTSLLRIEKIPRKRKFQDLRGTNKCKAALVESAESKEINPYNYLLQKITCQDIMLLSTGDLTPLIRLRKPLREFVEYSCGDVMQTSTMQEQVAKKFILKIAPHLQSLLVPKHQTVDVPKTFESLLKKFYLEFSKHLFDKETNDAIFAEETMTLITRLQKECSSILEFLVRGGEDTIENILSNFITKEFFKIKKKFSWSIIFTILSLGKSETSSLTEEEIRSLLIFRNIPCDKILEQAHTRCQNLINNNNCLKENIKELKMNNEELVKKHGEEVKKSESLSNEVNTCKSEIISLKQRCRLERDQTEKLYKLLKYSMGRDIFSSEDE